MTAINTALFHMARESVCNDGPRNPLPRMRPCRNCRGTEHVEIGYRLLSRTWTIECACGAYTGQRRTLRAALINWNKENKP